LCPDLPPLCFKGCIEQEIASKVLVEGYDENMNEDEYEDEMRKKVTMTRNIPIFIGDLFYCK
jgi:hypothetical protein